MLVHVVYLGECFVRLRSAPLGIPCLESFGSRDGSNILLYEAQDVSEFERLSRLQQSSSSLSSDLEILQHLRLRSTYRPVFVIRKLQDSKVLFSELPTHMVLTPAAYVSVAALSTDSGNYDIKLLDFNPEVRDCQLLLVYRDVEYLNGSDMLDVTLWRALSIQGKL